MEDLIAEVRLPEDLKLQLAERYASLGTKYATDEVISITQEGGETVQFRINACMKRDNLQDVEEEIVDAVFNALVYKYRRKDEVDDALINVLLGCWHTLKIERAINESKGWDVESRETRSKAKELS